MHVWLGVESLPALPGLGGGGAPMGFTFWQDDAGAWAHLASRVGVAHRTW